MLNAMLTMIGISLVTGLLGLAVDGGGVDLALALIQWLSLIATVILGVVDRYRSRRVR